MTTRFPPYSHDEVEAPPPVGWRIWLGLTVIAASTVSVAYLIWRAAK